VLSFQAEVACNEGRKCDVQQGFTIEFEISVFAQAACYQSFAPPQTNDLNALG
jgi:hypothetical protein